MRQVQIITRGWLVVGLLLGGAGMVLGQDAPANPDAPKPAAEPQATPKPDSKEKSSNAKGDAADQAKSDAKAGAEGAAPSASGRKDPLDGYYGSVEVWNRVRQFQRLHTAIEARVKLTAEQKTAIAKRFDELYHEMMTVRGRARRHPPPKRLWTEEELARLHASLAEAEQAGDNEKAGKIRYEIAEGTPNVPENLGDPIDVELEKLADLLNPDQREDFTRTLTRWQSIEPRSADGPIRMVGRAAIDPDLNLTPEQYKAIIDSLTKTSAEFQSSKRTDEDKEKIAAKSQAAVSDILNDAQKEMFHRNIAEFKKNDAEYRAFLQEQNRRRRLGLLPKAGAPKNE